MMTNETITNIMVMAERLPAAELQQFSGGDKDAILCEYARQQRDNLIDWIHEQRLSNQLVQIDKPSEVNLLRIKGTPTLAAALQCAPSILCVALVGDFECTLLET